MKVLMINGSPRLNGNTAIALDEMKKVFSKKLIVMALLAAISVSVAGCSLPFEKREPEIKQYEETAEPENAKEDTMAKMDWEEAVELAAPKAAETLAAAEAAGLKVQKSISRGKWTTAQLVKA